MPASDILTLRLPAKLNSRLAKLAKSTDRSRSRLAADAIEQYLDLNAWQVQAIEEGIEAADAGRLTPHGEIKDLIQAWAKPKTAAHK